MRSFRVLRTLTGLGFASSSVWSTSLPKSSSPWTLRGPSMNTGSWFSTSAVLRFPVVQFPLAQTGEGIAECELIKWLVKEGDQIKRFEKVCEVQSDKASIEISSPYEGTVTSLPHQPGDVVKVGSTLMEIDVEEGTPLERVRPVDAGESQKENVLTKDQGVAPGSGRTEHVMAAPTVRLLAKENKVNLADVSPTGPGGRVTKEDVLSFIENREQPAQRTETDAKKIPIKGFRRSMLKNMSTSVTIPHFHFCDDVDMTAMLTMRKQLADEPQLRGLHFTLLPLLIKALSAALLEFPEVNSSLSEDHSELILHSKHHIGIAMATDAGLVVPNVKNVQEKTVVEIAHELYKFKSDASENCLKPEDLQNGTITVSNIGSVGGVYATPLIVPPQTAIVALGKMRSVLCLKNGDSVVRSVTDLQACPMLPISWGADHRVLDGASLVDFSNRWKQFIEEPDRLMIYLK